MKDNVQPQKWLVQLAVPQPSDAGEMTSLRSKTAGVAAWVRSAPGRSVGGFSREQRNGIEGHDDA